MSTLSPEECQQALQVAFRHYVLGETTYTVLRGLDEGRTVAELATQLGITRQAVEYRRNSGKARIAEFMARKACETVANG